jgi:hypothetical protein
MPLMRLIGNSSDQKNHEISKTFHSFDKGSKIHFQRTTYGHKYL